MTVPLSSYDVCRTHLSDWPDNQLFRLCSFTLPVRFSVQPDRADAIPVTRITAPAFRPSLSGLLAEYCSCRQITTSSSRCRLEPMSQIEGFCGSVARCATQQIHASTDEPVPGWRRASRNAPVSISSYRTSSRNTDCCY